MASERDTAIRAAREMYVAAIDAANNRHDQACEAVGVAWSAERDAAASAYREALAEIDRDHPQEGR